MTIYLSLYTLPNCAQTRHNDHICPESEIKQLLMHDGNE